MDNAVKVLFASGSEAVIARTVERLKTILPELPLVVVAEFEPPDGRVDPLSRQAKLAENRAWVKAKLAGRKIRISAVILEPRTPYWGLRALGFAMAPLYFLAFNENGEHFMLRPRSAPTILRHLLWRVGNFLRWQLKPGGGSTRSSGGLRIRASFGGRLCIGWRCCGGNLFDAGEGRPGACPTCIGRRGFRS